MSTVAANQHLSIAAFFLTAAHRYRAGRVAPTVTLNEFRENRLLGVDRPILVPDFWSSAECCGFLDRMYDRNEEHDATLVVHEEQFTSPLNPVGHRSSVARCLREFRSTDFRALSLSDGLPVDWVDEDLRLLPPNRRIDNFYDASPVCGRNYSRFVWLTGKDHFSWWNIAAAGSLVHLVVEGLQIILLSPTLAVEAAGHLDVTESSGRALCPPPELVATCELLVVGAGDLYCVPYRSLQAVYSLTKTVCLNAFLAE